MQCWKKEGSRKGRPVFSVAMGPLLAMGLSLSLIGCGQGSPNEKTQPPNQEQNDSGKDKRKSAAEVSVAQRGPAPQPGSPLPAPLPPAPRVASTRLNLLVDELLDRTSNQLEEVERVSAQTVAEVFNEDDLIRPKIWEIQNLIKERYQQNRYGQDESEKIQVLEAGLATAAKDREYWDIGQDAGIILGSAIGLAVLRGYGVDQVFKEKAVQAAQRAGETSRKLFEGRTYREIGERVQNRMAKSFHKLTPAEKLSRHLESLGLDPSEIRFIESHLLPPSSVDHVRLQSFREFIPTRRRDLRVAAIKSLDPEPDHYAHLAFELIPSRMSKAHNTYFQTDALNKDEVRTVISKLVGGGRPFVDFVDESGRVATSRVTADRFKNAVSSARNIPEKLKPQNIKQTMANAGARVQEWYRSAAGRASQSPLVTSFNSSRAAQTFVYSSLLLGGGYALALTNEDIGSSVYLESLINTESEEPASTPTVQTSGE